MTKKELIILNQILQTLDLKGVKFNYAIAKNLDKIKPEISAMQKSIEMSKEYKKFDEERVELVKEFSKKDENGQPLIVDDQYILEDKQKFNAKFEKLKTKYKTEVADREKQLEEYNEMLNDTVTIDFHKIKLEYIPEDISTQQMSVLYPLITEDE